MKKIRDKQVRKLSKLLKLLVSAEWDMVAIGNAKRDNISLLAAESVSEEQNYEMPSINRAFMEKILNYSPDSFSHLPVGESKKSFGGYKIHKYGKK